MKDLYKKIVSYQNIKDSYFEFCADFEEKSKYRYKGIDGNEIRTYDFLSENLIKEIQQELSEKKNIDPSLKMLIPKGNKPGNRTIFIHTIKERIKALAIYRIINPILDEYLSEYLYSYRSSHPHYKAASAVAKKYRKSWRNDYVLIGDISDYCDNIDKEILKQKIKAVNFDEQTNKLINLYIDNQYSEGGQIKKLNIGLVHGQPLISVFYNIYVDDIDKKIGKMVSLYRRVGDDFILIDKNLEKINKAKELLVSELIKNKIPENKQKIKVQKASEPFNFLGYKFSNGKISISDSSRKKILHRWKKRFKYRKNWTDFKKQKFIESQIYKKNPVINEFLEIIKHYSQADNQKQFKELSNYFFKCITIFYYGKHSSRKQRLTIEKTKKLKIPSIHDFYVKVHGGKKIQLLKDIDRIYGK